MPLCTMRIDNVRTSYVMQSRIHGTTNRTPHRHLPPVTHTHASPPCLRKAPHAHRHGHSHHNAAQPDDKQILSVPAPSSTLQRHPHRMTGCCLIC